MEKFNLTKTARKELIQKEFREALTRTSLEVPEHTSGVVVLSGKEFAVDASGNLEIENRDNQENEARIKAAIEISRAVASRNASSKDTPSEAVTLPVLILNGTTRQLPIMRDIALKFGWPEDKIELVDCGPAGSSNTKTQFEAIRGYYEQKRPAHLTFITSDYHVPRAERTANAQLDQASDFEVISAPSDLPFDVYQTVRGEVRRISSYSDKGDITADRKRPT